MFYNFYIYLVILATFSPILAYNKQKILNKITISEEFLYDTCRFFTINLFKIYKKKKTTKIDNHN